MIEEEIIDTEMDQEITVIEGIIETNMNNKQENLIITNFQEMKDGKNIDDPIIYNKLQKITIITHNVRGLNKKEKILQFEK